MWFDYVKFSFATAIAPGYIATIKSPGSTGYRLIHEYQAAATAESILEPSYAQASSRPCQEIHEMIFNSGS